MSELNGNHPNPSSTQSANTQKIPGKNFEGEKPFWASQTIWSAIAVIGSSVAGAWLAWKTGDMAAFGAALTALLGGINAVLGRLRATASIKK